MIICKIKDFTIRKYNRRGYYFSFRGLEKDNSIAITLNLQVEEYIDIIKKYNAQYDYDFNEYFFIKQEDIIKCVNYLNEKYVILLKLIGS